MTIRQRKYESRQQAEWRTFNAAMQEGNKAKAKAVYQAMTDEGNREQAKRVLFGATAAQKRESTERQQAISNSASVEADIRFMMSDSGFMGNEGF